MQIFLFLTLFQHYKENILHINPFKRITCNMAIAFKSAKITQVQLAKETVISAVLSDYALSSVQGNYISRVRDH